jgi:hypothetical protein
MSGKVPFLFEVNDFWRLILGGFSQVSRNMRGRDRPVPESPQEAPRPHHGEGSKPPHFGFACRFNQLAASNNESAEFFGSFHSESAGSPRGCVTDV